MSTASYSRYPGFFETTGSSTGLLVSIILHSALLLLIIIGWTPAQEPRKVSTPRYIEAELLQMEPAINEPAPPREEAKPEVDKEAARRAEEERRAEQQRQRELEEQRRQEQLEKQQAAEAERQRQEQLKREQEAKARAEAEKKRQEELQRELERQEALKKEAEAARQEALRREQREQELARALAQEEAAAQSQENLKQIGTYKGYMAGLIAANWNRPLSARRDMQVELEILLGSAGRVNGVRVLKSSGNAAFDRSAEQAVLKVGQFSRLQEMDPALYQREFRRVILIFRPEDLRM